MVELLLTAGADRDLLSEDNCTPLYYAVLGQHIMMVMVLVLLSVEMRQGSISP